ncbi:hypothetical protein Syun_024390 [Stephania yunnanensis]|uniref:Uncharacterized protein n=1 Tax=Stephania yunnanensis TaxID=152371 RepID=A0AAP0I4A9_9MAGN
MEMEIVSRDTIKPSFPTPSHLKTYNLSYFDQSIPSDYLIPILLYYPKPNTSTSSTTTTTSTSACLKESLSKCLTKFYPLAGRIKDGVSVDCNDAGVGFVEARVTNCSLLDVVTNPNTLSLRQLLPLDQPYTLESPLLLVRVNQFQCGGIAIGMCVSHKVSDVSSLSAFINGWSCAARGDSEVITPHFELAALFPWKYENDDQGLEATDEGPSKYVVVAKRFVFNALDIARLREKARNVESPTRVELVSAFIWKRFIEWDRSRSYPTSKPYSAFHVVSLKKRRAPPLAKHSFGNMSTIVGALLTAENDDNDEYCSLVGKIRGAIRGIDGEFVKKLESGDEGHLKRYEAEIMQASQVGNEPIHFTSWCRFGFYDADFGWGRPVWVATISLEFPNLVRLMDTRSGDGIEAWVNMLEEDIEGFANDPELLAFA